MGGCWLRLAAAEHSEVGGLSGLGREGGALPRRRRTLRLQGEAKELPGCQPKTHTLECVLVLVGGLGLHVVVHLRNVPMCNSNHSIGMSIKHTTLYSKTQRWQVFINTPHPSPSPRLRHLNYSTETIYYLLTQQ